MISEQLKTIMETPKTESKHDIIKDSTGCYNSSVSNTFMWHVHSHCSGKNIGRTKTLYKSGICCNQVKLGFVIGKYISL